MNKKDVKLIGYCFILFLLFGIVLLIFSNSHEGSIGVVEYKDEKILEFNLNQDGTYEFEGSYGLVHLEVKDEKYRVFDVMCPNHNCEQMGWHDKDSLSPIVCMPNEIVIYLK